MARNMEGEIKGTSMRAKKRLKAQTGSGMAEEAQPGRGVKGCWSRGILSSGTRSPLGAGQS